MTTLPAQAQGDREFAYTADDYERTRKLIYDHSGISFSDGKANLVYSRLGKRVRALGLLNFRDYLDRVQADSGEFEEFVNALTTNLTSFYREEHHFAVLTQYIARRKRPDDLRIWCAASSTGEEPYTLAMTLAQAYGTLPPPVTLIATDLDSQVLATAARGVYPLESIDRVSDAERKQYFLRGIGGREGAVCVRPELRALIEFAQLNLCAPDWDIPAPVDVIFARNVLIYFDRPTQLRILQRFHAILGSDSLLITGHSEILFYATHLFEQVGKTVYRPLR